MVSPKPVTLTAGTNPNPGLDPEPLVAVGGFPLSAIGGLSAIPGYNATEVQTLQHDVSGNLIWTS